MAIGQVIDQAKATLTRFAQHLVLSFEQPNHGLQEHFVEPHLEAQNGALSAASTIFDNTPRTILLGGAGTGKTTLLRFRAWQTARAFLDNKERRCPILVSAHTLHMFVHDHPLEFVSPALWGFPSDVTFTQDLLGLMLERGDIEFLVDGLDEVPPNHLLSITRQLSDIFRRYPKVPAIVSSRPAALSVTFPDFAVYSLPGFNQSQLRLLVNYLTADQLEAGDQFYETILQSSQLSDLAKSPWMTKQLWSVFEARGKIPTNSASLYSDFVDTLLYARERAKGLGQRSVITLREKMTVLENVAIQLIERAQVHFDLQIVDAALCSIEPPLNAKLEGVVDELLSSGLIFKEPDLFSFGHKSFVEYFAARAIGRSPQDYIKLLDMRGVEGVFIFACGLMDDVGPLIEAAINKQQIVLAAKCISQGRTTNSALTNYVIGEFSREVGRPFVELLAGSVNEKSSQNAHIQTPTELLRLFDFSRDMRFANHERGAKFEDFAVGFLNEVFKVVSRDLRTENGELDIVVEITHSDPFWIEFGGDALVECKNWTSNIPLKEVGAFIHKVNQGRVKLAFIISVSGFTEDAMRTLRNHASNIAAPLVVPLTGESIKNALLSGVILEEFFKEKIRDMKYLRKY